MAICRIKVCGITNSGDARALASLGVDYLGYNFHPASVRYVGPDLARELIAAAPGPAPVGVFVDLPLPELVHIVTRTGIRYAQLHGDEDWDYVARVPVPVIKAIRHTDLAAAEIPDLPNLAYVLVDTVSGGRFGGTGQAFDWNRLRELKSPRPVFLAGGLGPANAAAAVRAARPFALDLNSQVESAPGRKDPALVRACLEAVTAV